MLFVGVHPYILMLTAQVDTIHRTFQIYSIKIVGLDMKEAENGVGFTNEGIVEVPVKH